MNSKQMRDDRAKLMTEALALIPKDNVGLTPEINEKFERMMAEVDAQLKSIETVETAEKISAELRAVQPIEMSAAVSGPEQRKAEVAAKHQSLFNTFLRSGLNGMEPEERKAFQQFRAQSDTVGAAGAFLIPQGFQQELGQALKWYGGMRQVARIVSTDSGNPVAWPTLNDTTQIGALLGGGAAPEADLTFGQIMVSAYTYTSKAVTVPNELLQDSAFDLPGTLRDAFATRLARIQNQHFTTYNTAGGPQGVVPFVTAMAGGITGAVGETTSVTYNNIVDLVHSLDPAYRRNAKFMWHDSTFAALRKLVDSQNRPLLMPGINGGDPDTVFGYPFQINSDIAPMAANAVSILFGDYNHYLIRDVSNSIAVMRLDQLAALSNQTVFVSFMRSDGRGITLGNPSIVSYTNSAT